MSESKTPTPRTDAAPKTYRYRSRASGLVYSNPNAAGDCDALIYVDADFARTLELELNEANRGRLAWASTCGKLCGEADELRSQLTTAQQEIAELRKDKERLDWLNNEPTDVEPDGDLLIWTTPFTYPSAYSTGDETIRQAIDSAMKGTKE